jgi:hypothetical protein
VCIVFKGDQGLEPTWLGSKNCLAKGMASQNLDYSKSRLVRANNLGMHLVECHDMGASTFPSCEIKEFSGDFTMILAIDIGVPIFLQ